MEVRRVVMCMCLFGMVVKYNAFSCGPDEICLCNSYGHMDCSGKQIPIWQACRFISNSTNNISALHLERNEYQNIGELDFIGCDQLYGLYLGENKISSIGKGSFANFSNLALLDISNNNLALYDKTVRQNFTYPLTIKTLMLNGNSKVNTNVQLTYPNLSYLTKLEVLYMDGLRDKVFPLSYRRIKALNTVVLSGLEGNCNISYILNGTLMNLPIIRKLNISACHIENIHAGAFKSLSNLEILDLSQNMRLGLRMLRNISYSLQFTSIKSLNISKVHTTFGMGTMLKKRDVCYLWNTTLNELVISSNRIRLAEINSLILLPKTLNILRAEDNIYTFAPFLLQLPCMANLTEFHGNYQNTAHNPLLYEKEPIENYKECINYDSDCPYMQNEFLQNISKRTELCPYFENDAINISNKYPSFPKQLRKVELARCNIEYNVPNVLVFPVNNSVEYLDFSGNIIYSWIGPIGPFPKLKYLNLSRNYCSYVRVGFFDSFKTIENLQLDENFLGLVIPDKRYGASIFDGLVNVKVLNLSSNIISYLPPTVFSNLLKLETLDLSVNNIETWTVDISALNNLMHLKLKFNSFHTLPDILMDKLESNARRLGKQFTIDLRNNSLTTNCAEKVFLKWMVKHRNNMLYFEDYTFYDKTGATVSVKQFVADVNNLDKECRSYVLTIVLSSIGISVFLAIVVGGVIYKNRWKLRYLMRITKIKHFGYIKLYNDPNELEHFVYDAFVSYANQDIRFILDKIIPKLEEQEMKLCLHDRDFLPGNNIADNILDAIRKSRKTVVILSKEFLKSKWCLYEFNMARMESIYSRDGASCLLVVMLEDVPTRNMTTEMLQWIRANTNIEYTTEEEGELLFWDNLIEALRE